MEKAFDFKDLGGRLMKRLKSQAVGAADDVLSWSGESLLLSENAIMKGLGGVVIAIKAVTLAEISKAVGNNQPALTAAVADSGQKPLKV